MSSIVQDFKDYKKSKKNIKSIDYQINLQFRKMLKPISFSESENYYSKLSALTEGAQTVYAENKDKNELAKYMKKNAPLVYLPSCFCIISVSALIKPKTLLAEVIVSDIMKNEYDARQDKALRCVHNTTDGTIYENNCMNCSKEIFKNLVEYQSLKAKLQIAQEKKKATKQKLLSRFRLIKQK